MRPVIETRERFEIEALTIRDNVRTWQVVSHPETEAEAQTRFDALSSGEANGLPNSGYDALRIRHRIIRETLSLMAPDGFEVVINWREGYEGEDHKARFFSREVALAFASEGNDPASMASVHCVNLKTGVTEYTWKPGA